MPSAPARAAVLACLAAVLAALPLAGAHAAAAAGGFASPHLAPGATFSVLFDGPGSYTVHCHLHPEMMAELVVLPDVDPAGPQAHRVAIVDYAFVDEAGGTHTTVHAGDTVTWTNSGNQTHDVHLLLQGVTTSDSGVFEASVLGGLAVALVGILWVSRRS